MRVSRILRGCSAAKEQLVDVVQMLPLVELLGDRRVLIENHKGVVLYSHDEIDIKLNIGLLCITGRDLHIAYISGQRLVINGLIKSITISGK